MYVTFKMVFRIVLRNQNKNFLKLQYKITGTKSIHLYITLWGKKIRNINLHIHSSPLINVMVRTKY